MKLKKHNRPFANSATLSAMMVVTFAALAPSPTLGADIQWDGSDSTDWSTGANWVGDVVPGAADKAFINNITVNTPAVTADATVSELLIGFGGTTGAVNVTAGTLSVDAWTVVGNGSGGSGTLNLTGSGSLTKTAVNGGSNFFVGEGAGSTGVLNINTTGSFTSAREVVIGYNSGKGTLNLAAGAMTVNNVFRVGSGGTGPNGTVNYTGGTLALNNAVRIGANTNAVTDVNIGTGTVATVSAAGTVRIGEGPGSNNTLDIDGTLNMLSVSGEGSIRIGHNSNTTTATNTVTVNTGGVLYSEGDMIHGYAGNTGSTNTLNINGGTVNVASTTLRWMKIGHWDGQNSVTNITNSGALKLNTNSNIKMGFTTSVKGSHVINVDGGSLIGYADNGTTTANASATIDMSYVASTMSAALNIKNGGVVEVRAIFTNNNTTSAVVNFDNGTLRATGNDLNLIRLNGTGTRQVNLLAGGGTIDSNGYDVTIGTAFSGTGALTKAGVGTLTLSGASTYTGATLISNGTLSVGGTTSINGSSGVTINGANARYLRTSTTAGTVPILLTQGTLDGTGSTGPVTVADNAANILANGNGGTTALTASALTFQGDATINANYGGSTPLVVTGVLTTTPGNGQVTFNIPTTMLNGTHNLIQFGSFGGSAADFTLNLSGLNARQFAEAPAISGNNIAVTVSGDVPVWTGVTGQDWTTAPTDDSSGPNNWATKSGNAGTNFWVGDLAEFNDTYNLGGGDVGVTQNYVLIGSSVSPGTTIFNNSSVAYIIDSAGDGIATGTLTKNGTATTTLVGTHTYTGATTINAGTLKLGDGTFDGTIANTASVTNHGTLLYYWVSDHTAPYPISGTGNLVKELGGTLTLTGANTYSGGTTVSGGKLVAPSDSLNAGPISIASGATVTFTGNNQTSGSTVTGAGDIVNNTANNVIFTGDHSGFSGTFTHNAVANNSQFNSALSGSQNASYSLLDGEIIFAANGDYTVKFGAWSSNAGETIRGGNAATGTTTLEVGNLGTDTTIAGNLNNGATKVLALTKVGSGTLTLAGTNTYSGATAIAAGTLRVTGTSAASPILVNAGTTLDGTGSVGTVNVVDDATATITNGAGGSSKLTLASLIFAGDAKVSANKAAAASTGLAVTGAVGTTPANGTVTIDGSSPGWLVNADNNLITYGSFGGAIGNFTLGTVSGTNSRVTGSALVNTGSAIALHVTGDSIVWSGASGDTWTTAADGNSAGPNNWATKAGLAATNFWTYDNVEFNDTYNVGGGAVAVTQNVVSISGGDVTPAITTFNNSAVNYTLGSGDASMLAGGSLVKNGTGSLTLSTANTYVGGTAINNGSVILGDGAALGSGSIALNGGALNLNGQTAANAVVLGGGTVTGNGTLSGIVSGASLTKADASTLILTNTNTFNGGLTITAGTVSVARQVNLGAVGNDVTLNGGTLQTTSASFADWGGDLTRDIIVGASGGTLNIMGDRLVIYTGASGTLSGTGNLTITGDGALHTGSGAGVLVLVGAYTGFTGDLILDQGGTAEVDNATAISAGSTLILENSGQVTVANGKTVSNPIIVTGSGSVIAFNNTGTGIVAGTIALNDEVTVGLRDWYNYATARSGTISGAISGAGGLTTDRGTSTDTPTLTLSGINTYTGDTTVSEGTTVTLADNGGLKFVIGGLGVNNKVTGAGTATLDGDFTFDLTGAAIADGNSWTIVDTTTKSFTANFTVAGGFDDTDLDNKWTKVDGANTWTFDEATGLLTVTVGAPAGYASWAAINAPTGTANDDYDNDGVSNGVEYVLGGLATTNDLGKLPKASTSGGNLVFTFLRDQDSETPDTTVMIEVGTTLATWPTSYAVPNDPVAANPGVTVMDNGNGTDTITLTIQQGADKKKFARLVVTIQ